MPVAGDRNPAPPVSEDNARLADGPPEEIATGLSAPNGRARPGRGRLRRRPGPRADHRTKPLRRLRIRSRYIFLDLVPWKGYIYPKRLFCVVKDIGEPAGREG